MNVSVLDGAPKQAPLLLGMPYPGRRISVYSRVEPCGATHVVCGLADL
jgi:hypothetical protein